jgi:hypothetical protein
LKFIFVYAVFLLWNNGLREAVVNRDIFVFEHFFYSSAVDIVYFGFYDVNTFLLKSVYKKIIIKLTRFYKALKTNKYMLVIGPAPGNPGCIFKCQFSG